MREALRGVAAMVSFAVRADWRRAVAVAGLAVLDACLRPLLALWLKVITDAVVDGNLEVAAWAAAAMGAGLVVIFAASLGGFAVSVALQERTELLVDQRLVDLTAAVPGVEHHERPEYLDRLEVLRRSRQELSSTVRAIVQMVSAALQLAVTAVLLVTIHPLLAVLPVVAVPSFVVAGRSQRRIQAAEDLTAERTRQALHLFDLATTAGPGKELRVFRLGDELMHRYHVLWTDVDRIRDRAHLTAAVQRAAGWLLFGAGYAAALLLVVREAAGGRATPGDVMMAFALAGNLNQQIAGLAAITNWLFAVLQTVGRFLWLADYSAAAQAAVARPEPVPVPARVQRGIELAGVRFSYPGTEATVLDEVDLFLPAGATVAIVGDNGAGKTTLVKLLCRLYEPSAGSVLVDGIDVRDFDVAAWRERTSACFQDAARFELAAAEAVGVGDVDRIDDGVAVGGALARAGATDVTAAMPNGLATQLGAGWEGGVDLSGGQWQKLALARSMMREAPLLLVLDEPTSALDAETEHALFERYHRASKDVARETGGITVLVSHRFSTVRMADLIVVMADGRIVETGGHDDLVAAGRLYAELYELQARAYR